MTSQNNADAGLYTIGYKVIYAADQVEYLCSTQLEIQANETSDKVKIPPRFEEEEAQDQF